MKKYFNKFASRLLSLIALTSIMTAATSCEGVYDGEGDCDPKYYVRFVFDMNMEFADAFNEQVESVDLWIFDKSTGKLVSHVSDSGEALSKEGYKLPLNITPGDYRIVAWCGLKNNRHFKVNDNINQLTDATVTMKREHGENGATSSADLDVLFHGMIDISVPTWEDIQGVMYNGVEMPQQTERFGTQTVYEPVYEWNELKQQYDIVYTVSLIRDTNNIILSLEHLSGTFNLDQICIDMVDNNGSMFHDNRLNESDENITFHPWRTKTGTLDQGDMSRGSDDIYGQDGKDNRYADFISAEISTGRMVTGHDKIIRIWYKDTGQTIFQFPVTKWATQLRSAHYATMDEQEYLDRENKFDLMVFLQDDGRGGWMAVDIVINGWHIIENGESNI